MPKASSLINERCSLSFAYHGEQVALVYRPYSQALQDTALAGTGGEWTQDSLAPFLAQILLEWDLLEDDGSPYALTVEKLRVLPLLFLAAVASAIGEDMRPHPLVVATSGAS